MRRHGRRPLVAGSSSRLGKGRREATARDEASRKPSTGRGKACILAACRGELGGHLVPYVRLLPLVLHGVGGRAVAGRRAAARRLAAGHDAVPAGLGLDHGDGAADVLVAADIWLLRAAECHAPSTMYVSPLFRNDEWLKSEPGDI